MVAPLVRDSVSCRELVCPEVTVIFSGSIVSVVAAGKLGSVLQLLVQAAGPLPEFEADGLEGGRFGLGVAGCCRVAEAPLADSGAVSGCEVIVWPPATVLSPPDCRNISEVPSGCLRMAALAPEIIANKPAKLYKTIRLARRAFTGREDFCEVIPER